MNWRGACSQTRSGPRPVMGVPGSGTKVQRVARAVCEAVHGPAPEGKPYAGHTCPDGENKMCVNGNHLQWMSKHENEQWKHRSPAAPVQDPGAGAVDGPAPVGTAGPV